MTTATSAPQGNDDHTARNRRFVQRLAILSAETDRLALGTDERTRGVDGKASFLAVAAGVVIAAQTQHAWGLPWFVVGIPIVLAAVAVASSALAMRPVKRAELTPSVLISQWLDSESTTGAVEKSILLTKSAIADAREATLKTRGTVVAFGFAMLFLAVAALAAIYTIDIALMGDRT